MARMGLNDDPRDAGYGRLVGYQAAEAGGRKGPQGLRASLELTRGKRRKRSEERLCAGGSAQAVSAGNRPELKLEGKRNLVCGRMGQHREEGAVEGGREDEKVGAPKKEGPGPPNMTAAEAPQSADGW